MNQDKRDFLLAFDVDKWAKTQLKKYAYDKLYRPIFENLAKIAKTINSANPTNPTNPIQPTNRIHNVDNPTYSIELDELMSNCESDKSKYYNRLNDSILEKKEIIKISQNQIIKQMNWGILDKYQFGENSIQTNEMKILTFTMSQIRFYKFLESQKDNAQSVKMIEPPVTPSVIEVKELAIAPIEQIGRASCRG